MIVVPLLAFAPVSSDRLFKTVEDVFSTLVIPSRNSLGSLVPPCPNLALYFSGFEFPPFLIS